LADTISPERRSENMRRIRSKDMKPEMAVRRLVHGMGYRYRLHRNDLPGKPDLAFPSRRKAIFVHGCFWHQHASKRCKITRIPKSNQAYWLQKLERNRIRDARNLRSLRKLGWKCMVIWECRTVDLDGLACRIERFLGSAGSP
jgi:DNA mismatch endonuclease, patch repair protein